MLSAAEMASYDSPSIFLILWASDLNHSGLTIPHNVFTISFL